MLVILMLYLLAQGWYPNSVAEVDCSWIQCSCLLHPNPCHPLRLGKTAVRLVCSSPLLSAVVHWVLLARKGLALYGPQLPSVFAPNFPKCTLKLLAEFPVLVHVYIVACWSFLLFLPPTWRCGGKALSYLHELKCYCPSSLRHLGT